MHHFEFIEDVEEWLEPMGYETFWQAIAPYGVFGPGDREHCDRTLEDGIAPMGTVMAVTKAMFCWELTRAQDLQVRPAGRPVTYLAVVE